MDSSDKFRFVSDDEELDTSEASGAFENWAYYLGKTSSLPTHATTMVLSNHNIKSAVEVNPDDLANQLTLLDFRAFRTINRSELITCAWNKKNKLLTAPNVVAFIRRFNQVTYWTVEEVLTGSTPQKRSDILVHFIRVCQKLYELNNIHSLFAVISGLQSVSIYRLSKTWACLSKKDKSNFDTVAQLFNESNNWSTLRNYIKAVTLPCIPYLGLYLTDLIYLDVSENLERKLKISKMDEIIKSLFMFKSSNYNSIAVVPQVREYLSSSRYIDELEKFHEDNQYKLSLKLEPMKNSSAHSSKESVRTGFHSSSSTLSISGATSTLQRFFSRGHHKSQTLGTNVFLKDAHLIEKFNTSETPKNGQRNLLDDTPDKPKPSTSKQNLNTIIDSKTSLKYLNDVYLMEGPIEKKTTMKNGKRLKITTWHRFWIEIKMNCIIFYSPKSFAKVFSNQKSDYKKEPFKIMSLKDWTTTTTNDPNSNIFLLANPVVKTVYKFRAANNEMAAKWFRQIQYIFDKSSKSMPVDMMTFE